MEIRKSHFDSASKSYDQNFTETLIGKAQRNQVWKVIDSLALMKTKSILELNCGTGEDAHRWKTKGYEIIATDISSEMIEVAKGKFPDIPFKNLDIRNAESFLVPNQIIFSNFGGFNCLNSAEIEQFFRKASKILADSDKIILVIMGKKCIWDNFFLFLKFKFKEIGRRNTNTSIKINVAGTEVETFYFSPKEIEMLAGSAFKTGTIKPIGLFVPPSYLSKFFERKKRLLFFLDKLDRIFSNRIFANWADHYVICFQKK